MITQAEFKALTRQIVEQEFPSELDRFDRAADRWISRAYEQEGTIVHETEASQLGFVAEATAVLEFVQVIAATFVALKKVWDVTHGAAVRDGGTDLRREWRRQLVAAGLSEEKADSIVAKFQHDLIERLGAPG